ncbi:hypothetical protein AcW1_009199 [Taiwanofungus camphoratus]|nr:hypothetical protein AcW1_009199 [Antrodia cinnamomea]
MMDIPPVDVPFPQILDPLLSYLSSVLPPSVYDILVTILSHLISLLTSTLSLVAALASSSPSSWDAQTILSPLITLLAAYLALISFYRTTGWIIRTGAWFMKWGSILTALAAGTGWVLGAANANGENGLAGIFTGAGILPTLGGLVLDMINGQGQNAAGGPRNARSARTSRSQTQKAPRPKAWEAWDQHRDWQYNENNRPQGNGEGLGTEVQKFIEGVVGAAGQVLSEGEWWDAAKGIVDQVGQRLQGTREDGEREPSGRKQPDRKTKSRTGSR